MRNLNPEELKQVHGGGGTPTCGVKPKNSHSKSKSKSNHGHKDSKHDKHSKSR
jgi:hypothetical protein